MKRELKLSSWLVVRSRKRGLQSLSRWKGNWNTKSGSDTHTHTVSIAEPIPMKRELKRSPLCLSSMTHLIAEPIPMKRELKHVQLLLEVNPVWAALQSLSRWKGNWNENLGNSPSKRSFIAEPIPMKRELKLLPGSTMPLTRPLIAEPIPMKRELKQEFIILRC